MPCGVKGRAEVQAQQTAREQARRREIEAAKELIKNHVAELRERNYPAPRVRRTSRSDHTSQKLAPAWEVGMFDWSQNMPRSDIADTYATHLTGVTPEGEIVPMMCAASWEGDRSAYAPSGLHKPGPKEYVQIADALSLHLKVPAQSPRSVHKAKPVEEPPLPLWERIKNLILG